MQKSLFLLSLAISFIYCARPAMADDSAGAYQFIGRFDNSQASGPRFNWSGSAIVARFQGNALSVKLAHERSSAGNPIYYTYIIDGQPRKSFPATSDAPTNYVLASTLDAGVHTIYLARETEGEFGISQFLGFNFGQGGLLLSPPPAPKRMEVIGDSISAGYGDNGTPGCNYSTATQSEYLAYGSVAARALGMDLTTIAYSGKGIHNNWNTTANIPQNPTMLHDFLYTLTPWVYTPALSDEGKSLYDFTTTAAPDLVVINLGTNDFNNSALTQTDFTSSYLTMLALVRSKYAKAPIFAAVGSILGPQRLAILRAAVQAAVQQANAKGDLKVYYADITADGTKWLGCGGHPDSSQSAAMGEALATSIRKQFGDF